MAKKLTTPGGPQFMSRALRPGGEGAAPPKPRGLNLGTPATTRAPTPSSMSIPKIPPMSGTGRKR